MGPVATSNAQSEYLVLQLSYTTAEIEESRFFGETSNPFYFAMPQSPAEMQPVVFTVIDGEARIVKDESPPGARLPDPASGLFRLANAPALHWETSAVDHGWQALSFQRCLS